MVAHISPLLPPLRWCWTMARGALIPVPGGVLINDKNGALLGAIGISGDTSDNDETAALAGIAAAGLVGNAG